MADLSGANLSEADLSGAQLWATNLSGAKSREGRNVQIDFRWAASDVEAMQRFAKELIALQPDLILSNNTPTTKVLLQQTHSIPIIFATVAYPIGSGFNQQPSLL